MNADAPKYFPGRYFIYLFNSVGGRLKDLTQTTDSLGQAQEIGMQLIETHEHVTSYVILRVVQNSILNLR